MMFIHGSLWSLPRHAVADQTPWSGLKARGTRDADWYDSSVSVARIGVPRCGSS
jgi:hypothetical protein